MIIRILVLEIAHQMKGKENRYDPLTFKHCFIFICYCATFFFFPGIFFLVSYNSNFVILYVTLQVVDTCPEIFGFFNFFFFLLFFFFWLNW